MGDQISSEPKFQFVNFNGSDAQRRDAITPGLSLSFKSPVSLIFTPVTNLFYSFI